MDSPKVQPAHELYSNGQRYLFLFILFLTSVLSFADRLALTVVLEPIKAEFDVSDTFLGLLSGFSFAALYASLGLPVARLADWSNRRTILSAAVVIRSAMTFASGQVTSFWQLAVVRIGVGAGDAGSMPPAQSLIASAVSDYRAATLGAESLRTALLMMTCVIPPGSWLFWRAAWSIVADTEA